MIYNHYGYPQMSPFGDGPDFVVGEFLGARQFMLTPEGTLTGMTYRQVWTDGENQAYCFREFGALPDDFEFDYDDAEKPYISSHVADPACRCGFYSYFSRTGHFTPSHYWSTPMYSQYHAFGVVENWGRVTAGSKGFRASKARIVALCVDVQELASRPNPDFRPGRSRWWKPRSSAAKNLPATLLGRLEANYPSVEFYDDQIEMLKNHPPSVPPHIR